MLGDSGRAIRPVEAGPPEPVDRPEAPDDRAAEDGDAVGTEPNVRPEVLRQAQPRRAALELAPQIGPGDVAAEQRVVGAGDG
eukprot:9951585-Alexandrium_andersonii.AAC.1